MAGSTEKWASYDSTTALLAPVQVCKKRVKVLDSKICWHPHVETVDHLVRDLTSSRILGINVTLNGAKLTHRSRVLFLHFGKVFEAVIAEGEEWRGIHKWVEVNDICYSDGCAVHVHFTKQGRDTTYVYSRGEWRKRKKNAK